MQWVWGPRRALHQWRYPGAIDEEKKRQMETAELKTFSSEDSNRRGNEFSYGLVNCPVRLSWIDRVQGLRANPTISPYKDEAVMLGPNRYEPPSGSDKQSNHCQSCRGAFCMLG